jgi:hypothetical protein
MPYLLPAISAAWRPTNAEFERGNTRHHCPNRRPCAIRAHHAAKKESDFVFKYILKKIVGSKNQREIKKMQPIIQKVGSFEPELKKLSDAQLKAKTSEFREKIDNGAPLDDLLPEVFATVREVGVRTVGMRHYDVQLVGGIALHRGTIAEMKTGEGKTLVATLPLVLNALPGKGAHLVTVNDYLAARDAEWMGQIYRFMGLSVGVIYNNISDIDRQAAYRADITYGDEQRVRLRLPARQHERLHRAIRAARAQLRDRRRGRLDPDRRGAHAADHQRSGRAVGGPLSPRQPHHSEPAKRRALRGGRKGAQLDAHRCWRRSGGKEARHQQPLRSGQYSLAAPRAAITDGPHALQARRQLPDPRRQGVDHRRAHRPRDGRSPLVGRSASGRRSQRKRQDRRGKPNPGDDHLSKLLSHVQQAGRHDRYG